MFFVFEYMKLVLICTLNKTKPISKDILFKLKCCCAVYLLGRKIITGMMVSRQALWSLNIISLHPLTSHRCTVGKHLVQSHAFKQFTSDNVTVVF